MTTLLLNFILYEIQNKNMSKINLKSGKLTPFEVM